MAEKKATKAERVAWMSKTSDIVGSHLKTDLDSYLTLIRRKVQEKCATTHELITLIRRSKIGDSKFVTPNEFRFTLIKFGVIIAQPLVDIIFNVFDSDRSGSMDFDEFAMWIMNSEFKPSVAATTKRAIAVDSPEEVLRRKLAACIKEHEDVFMFMKKKISFLEFVSEINRKNMRLTDVEARQIFLKFDPANTGFIDSAILTGWGKSGIIPEAPKPQEHSSVIPSLAQCINIVSVRNSKQMERCFSHIPEGAGVRIQYEEFRRCLVQGGLGKNALDCRDLFMALGGESGVADIDSLLRACKKLHLPENPRGDGVAKMQTPSYVSVGRAARRLRDAMRKSFHDVKTEIMQKDVTGSGFINAQDLHAIMVKHCMPITFQDFRFIVQQLRTEDGGSKIDWKSFLHLYNPKRAPHQLSNSTSMGEVDFAATAPSATYSRPQNSIPPLENQTLMSTSGNNGSQSFTQLRPVTTMTGKSRSSMSASASATSEVQGDLRKMWQTALRACHKADPDRSGRVSRVSFIQALEAANPDNGMPAEKMNKLADEYTNSSGLIDYLCCFREFLTDISSGNFAIKEDFEPYRAAPSHQARDKSASHPWDFKYKRERHAMPYWTLANTIKDGPPAAPPVIVPTTNEKATRDLTLAEREALLSQYNQKTLSICSKCYTAFIPMWKALRNELQRSQIISQRGSIIVERFQAILEHYGARLSKSEWGTIVRAFRGLGPQDVVKFDEFLRVCMLVKGNYEG